MHLATEERIIKKRNRISDRQKRWLWAFFTTSKYNATAAAREVGYAWPNHSGPENLQKLKKHIDHLTHRDWDYEGDPRNWPKPISDRPDELKAYIDAL